MRFSRLSRDLAGTANELYKHVGKLQADGVALVDLVRGNVNEHGIVFPQEPLDEILRTAAEQARKYHPDPLGQSVAREAIARYSDVAPEQIILTPGTSVSYWYLFKLLCNPGDEILCPAPTYPLFDYIAQLSGVGIRYYNLDEDRGWRINLDQMEAQLPGKTRGIVLISPHNPTGMVAEREQVEGLARIAERHELPIISDEVFAEFVFDGSTAGSLSEPRAPLIFNLNGFSKMFALPGLKIGWMAVRGDPALVGRAMKTLELMSDTFLPVNEIAQFSVPGIFDRGQGFLSEFRTTIETRRNAALSALAPSSGVPPKGGFYMVVPFEREIGEEELAIELLDTEHALVHPGYFYDIEGHHLVFSYVSESETLGEVLPKIRNHL